MAGVRGRYLLWGALLGWPALARGADDGIAVDVPERGCPARAQIVAALEARLPGVTNQGAEARRVELAGGPAASPRRRWWRCRERRAAASCACARFRCERRPGRPWGWAVGWSSPRWG